MDAYRRLFPPAYVKTARLIPAENELHFLALWGQFLNADGTVRESIADLFLSCIEAVGSWEQVLKCFPFQPLSPESGIEGFYLFYGLE